MWKRRRKKSNYRIEDYGESSSSFRFTSGPLAGLHVLVDGVSFIPEENAVRMKYTYSILENTRNLDVRSKLVHDGIGDMIVDVLQNKPNNRLSLEEVDLNEYNRSIDTAIGDD